MSDLDVQIPTAFDPFADANAEDSGAGAKEYVHIRIQQRNGRKSLTTVQGLKKEFSYNKILKDLKKEFCCNGTVVQDPELGQVIQLQGDQRKNVSTFLVQAGIVKKENIKIHVAYPSKVCNAVHWASISGIHCYNLAENINALKVFTNSRLKFDVMVPGSGIPEWFSHQSVDSSIKANQPWINIS
ncbi:hypothetical protein GOBAR_AA01623 [Gossypium barbadense]|uniref:SUI1 domain-containing protein n=1 Tax=Gossypium barbadense TaxID=3634 RepID=A0A2P5YTQ8_GOSBA|nr:hypothetical protein GOBAR_AA01623 [Gossypium barbadense]